ncbi:hypothetical protein C0585_06895 [Candidatus Woesearchaeota archaeon]|nr:MAG: hypothetical protein C0585_06895 [Candidatus Woesearchaeota archaeon]
MSRSSSASDTRTRNLDDILNEDYDNIGQALGVIREHSREVKNKNYKDISDELLESLVKATDIANEKLKNLMVEEPSKFSYHQDIANLNFTKSNFENIMYRKTGDLGFLRESYRSLQVSVEKTADKKTLFFAHYLSCGKIETILDNFVREGKNKKSKEFMKWDEKLMYHLDKAYDLMDKTVINIDTKRKVVMLYTKKLSLLCDKNSDEGREDINLLLKSYKLEKRIKKDFSYGKSFRQSGHLARKAKAISKYYEEKEIFNTSLEWYIEGFNEDILMLTENIVRKKEPSTQLLSYLANNCVEIYDLLESSKESIEERTFIHIKNKIKPLFQAGIDMLNKLEVSERTTPIINQYEQFLEDVYSSKKL